MPINFLIQKTSQYSSIFNSKILNKIYYQDNYIYFNNKINIVRKNAVKKEALFSQNYYSSLNLKTF